MAFFFLFFLHRPQESFTFGVNNSNTHGIYLNVKTFQRVYSHVFLYSQVCKDEDDVSVSSDSLGEQLFELVDVYNTGHSQKITGK